MSFLISLADRIDWLNERIGRALSWLVLFTVVTAAAVSILRYVFSIGWVWMQDAYVWANATLIMMGCAYTLLHDKHVRVDFIYASRSSRFRAGVNFFGTLFLLIPTTITIFWYSYPYVGKSWARLESTPDVGGLPFVYLLKTVIVLFCIPLLAQGISLLIRSYLQLVGLTEEDAQHGGPANV
ncbi:MAG: TRAP transporter small permease subunit [Pseudaminobacter sp.]